MINADPGRVLLVVDDEDDIRVLLQMYLGPAGYDVRTANDGLEALERLADTHVDLMLLDLRMPKLDGWGVLQRMRDDPKFAAVPTVVLSAHASPEAARRALEAGAVAFLNKPVSQEDLLALLAEHLDRRDR